MNKMPFKLSKKLSVKKKVFYELIKLLKHVYFLTYVHVCSGAQVYRYIHTNVETRSLSQPLSMYLLSKGLNLDLTNSASLQNQMSSGNSVSTNRIIVEPP